MIVYCLIISAILIGISVYELYNFYRLKYESLEMLTQIKNIEEYQVFQRPSTTMLSGEKRALKIELVYTINDKTYTKAERISERKFQKNDENKIRIWVLKKQPEKCTLKPHSVRRTRVWIACCITIFWSFFTYNIV